MRRSERSRVESILGKLHQPGFRSFPPIFRADARVLILGSMPGVESLRRGEYYAHPRNSFWPIMGALFNAGPDLPYPARIERLCEAGIAVWDVIASCQRRGSLDSEIVRESIRPNDIPALVQRAPRLQLVFFNGAAAEYWFWRCFGPRRHRPPLSRLQWARLPSTSPAHASLSPRQKLYYWRMALATGLSDVRITTTPV